MFEIAYYDKQGTEIDFDQYIEYTNDLDYKRVARNVLEDGKVVSTVWLGLDHGYDEGDPVIFESMIFENKDNYSDLYMDRYHTIEEALEGHKRAVEIAPTLVVNHE